MKTLKVLIACEESQAVCKEFRKLGHMAFSCDILPCSGGHPEWHIQGDVISILEQEWDMIIAFPPCTHLAVSGARYFAQKIKDGRQQEGIDFFMKFANCKCQRVAIENPVGIMSTKWRKPNQIIQPFQFGNEAKKTTCLWLKGLPNLKHTKIVSEGKFYISPNGKKMASWSHDPVDKNGKKIGYNTEAIKILRSKTFPGIAKALATQYSEFIKSSLTVQEWEDK
ncbi:MAG TPA: DNA cytosine methyltransferase [Candidatus Pacearchaeota archaeon]|nr:DNA cytosine methyltransferase [Candidatus Pacearchaeota archaeon]